MCVAHSMCRLGVVIFYFILPMITHGMDMCMRHKYETFERFKEFKYEVEKHIEKLTKVLRSDRRGKYLS